MGGIADKTGYAMSSLLKEMSDQKPSNTPSGSCDKNVLWRRRFESGLIERGEMQANPIAPVPAAIATSMIGGPSVVVTRLTQVQSNRGMSRNRYLLFYE